MYIHVYAVFVVKIVHVIVFFLCSLCTQNTDSGENPPYLEEVHWVKGKLIGTGAFCSCFLARDIRNGTMFAVKQVHTVCTCICTRYMYMSMYLYTSFSLCSHYKCTCTCIYVHMYMYQWFPKFLKSCSCFDNIAVTA